MQQSPYQSFAQDVIISERSSERQLLLCTLRCEWIRGTYEIPTIATTKLQNMRPARGVLGDFGKGAVSGEDDEVLITCDNQGVDG